MFPFICLVVLSFSVIPMTCSAYDSAQPLQEIVVTALSTEEPLGDVTHDITVITRREIERKNVAFLPDLLRSLPDIQIAQNGGPGTQATLFLRGGSSNQVVVMVDGVKLNSPSTGSVDISGIAVDDIERIEILKGPQGALYGSEAMAGVVNIVTKRAREPLSLSLTAEGGAFGTWKGGGSLSGSSGIWDYRLTASAFDSHGISAASSGSEKDSYTQTFLSARLGAAPSQKIGFEITTRYEKSRTDLDGYDFTSGVVDSLTAVQKLEQYLIAAKGYFAFSEQYRQVLRVSRVDADLKLIDPGVAYNNALIKTVADTVDWQHVISAGNSSAVAGGEIKWEHADNEGWIDETVTNYALYFNGKVKFAEDRLVASGGLRYDHYETAGSQTTYRGGILWSIPGYGIRLKANYGTGFRAPSLNELYFPFFGNPLLRPEKSKGFDGGFEASLPDGTGSLSATYFSQNYSDLIQYDFQTYLAENIGKAAIKGVELGLTLRPIDSIRARVSYTYMDSRDEETDQPLTRRPRHKAVSQVEYASERWSLFGEYIYVSHRYDSAASRTLSSYGLVNLYATYRAHKSFEFFARINNLFNADYEEIGGYGTPGTAVYCGMRVTL